MTGFVPWGPDFFGGAAGSINLQINQSIEDIKARANFWQVPDFNAGFSSYPGLAGSSMDVLLNPYYTIGQVGFNGGFNGGSNMNSIFPGLNAGMSMFAPGYGSQIYGGGSNGSGSTSSTPKTREEKLMDIENKNIIALLEKLAKSNVLDSDSKDLLKEDLKEAKKIKSIKDRNETLKEIYDEYKSDVQKFVVSHDSKSIALTGGNLDVLLDKIGYERSDSDIENEGHISKLKEAIDGLGKEQGSMSISNIAKTMGETNSEYNVLDVVSSYNTAYPDENLAEHISAKYKTFSKSDKKREMHKELETFGKEMAKRLAEAAERELEYVEDETVKNSLKEKIDKVRTLELKDSDYVSKFNELYAITRVLAARNLGNQLESKYGKIDSETFNKKMFLDSTKEDLNKEFKGAYNSSLSTVEAVKLKKRASSHTPVVENKNNQVKDDDKFDKKLATLKESSLDEKTDKVTIDDEEYTVYEEKTGSNEDGSKKQYVVVDEKFYEITTDSAGKTTKAEEETKASDIQKAVKAANDKVKAAEEKEDEAEKALREAEKKAVIDKFKRDGVEITLEDTNETKTDSEGNTVPVYKMKKPTGDVVKVYVDSDGSVRRA